MVLDRLTPLLLALVVGFTLWIPVSAFADGQPVVAQPREEQKIQEYDPKRGEHVASDVAQKNILYGGDVAEEPEKPSSAVDPYDPRQILF